MNLICRLKDTTVPNYGSGHHSAWVEEFEPEDLITVGKVLNVRSFSTALVSKVTLLSLQTILNFSS